MRGNSPNITEDVKNKILFVKSMNPDFKPRDIHKFLHKHHEGYKLTKREIPEIRSIQNILSRPENKVLIEKIKNNPLNQPWTIGLSMKYEIPANIVPVLIRAKQLLDNKLTIRIARWFAYLYPTLAPAINEKYSEKYPNETPRLGLIYEIVKQYARKEILYEISKGEIVSVLPAPDTTDIDEQYFIKGDLSEIAIWGNFFEIFLPKTVKMWEARGGLTKEQTDLLMHADEIGKGQEWIDTHPSDVKVLRMYEQIMDVKVLKDYEQPKQNKKAKKDGEAK